MSNTQSNSSNNTKTVLYYGKEIQVPHKATWVHTDSNGSVFWSTERVPALDTCFDTVSGTVQYGAVGWLFNHTEMSTINWMLSQKRILDLPSVSSGLEHKAHPHADLMLKHAQIAQYSDKPWEEFQYKSIDGVWIDCVKEVPFYTLVEYQLKPHPIRIKEGQVWRSTKESVLIKVHSVKHPELQNGSIVVAQRINPELTLYSELTKTELQEHFTLVK